MWWFKYIFFFSSVFSSCQSPAIVIFSENWMYDPIKKSCKYLNDVTINCSLTMGHKNGDVKVNSLVSCRVKKCEKVSCSITGRWKLQFHKPAFWLYVKLSSLRLLICWPLFCMRCRSNYFLVMVTLLEVDMFQFLPGIFRSLLKAGPP